MRPFMALGILFLLGGMSSMHAGWQPPMTVRGMVIAYDADSAIVIAAASVTMVARPSPDSTVFLAGTETADDGRFVLRVGVAAGTDCHTLVLIVRKRAYRAAEIRSLCDSTRLLRMGVQLEREVL